MMIEHEPSEHLPCLDSARMRLDRCTHDDYLQILTDLEDFWEKDRARAVHHPILVHEFADTAWVVREDGRILAYLFAFWSQAEPLGYIHLVGVRRSHQRRGIGRRAPDRSRLNTG